MKFKIFWNNKATKELKKIHHKDRIRILVKVRTVEFWPDVSNVKFLKNFNPDYRLRIGGYRIFFSVDETIKIVKIERIKKRNERTY